MAQEEGTHEEEWKAYQLQHAPEVKREDDHNWTLDTLKYIGGLDITFSTKETNVALGCLVVCEYPSCKEILKLTLRKVINVPYISGYLGFREVEVYKELLEMCKKDHSEFYPEVVLVDGNGVYHPRRFGSATHVGFACDIPSIGVAKTVLLVDGVGKTEINKAALSINPGDSIDVNSKKGEVLCAVIRSSGGGKNPIIVSCGNKVSLTTAVAICKTCCLHKIPEPIRLADLDSRKMLRDEGLLPHLSPK
ncbi:endonuclease V, putative [Entamoeba invadens IP1]|uniref:Endonuclease V, putative n=1 Tax=Entamoeba invadens IP1 TaxID=370355 RepID=A0A0A1U5A1_ENTIV|nr:endonuclease V, putative [Entamoeba invadens IP1]ELP86936.1 endonuclease V, putative [Entamoeba invadens IP1]|eukprot:XP_004253707.1 endonuclease V, putative [Entamoeba invadens IP1]